MKTLMIAMALAMSTGAFAQQPASPGAEAAPAFKSHVLSKTEVDHALAHPEKTLFIDVRRPDEITAHGGFPVYLSVQSKDLETSLKWIPKDRQIVTVSNHAARAGKAADLLTAHGFKVLGAVGSDLYEKDGGTLTKIVAPPPAAPAAAH